MFHAYSGPLEAFGQRGNPIGISAGQIILDRTKVVRLDGMMPILGVYDF